MKFRALLISLAVFAIGSFVVAGPHYNPVVAGFTDPYTPADGTLNIVGELSVQGSSGHANSLQVGEGASTSTFDDSVAIGATASVTGNDGTAIGYGATAFTDTVAVGKGALALWLSGAVAVGDTAQGGGTDSVAIGRLAATNTSSTGAVVVGAQAGIATNNDYTVAIGASAQARETGEIVLGNPVLGNYVPMITSNAHTATNQPSTGLIIAAPQGTGTGSIDGARLVQKGLLLGSTGATRQTRVTRVAHSNHKASLTDAGSNNLYEIALADGEMAAGQIFYAVFASDGTDHQATSGSALITAVNKGDVYTTSDTERTEDTSASTGTLTTAWAVTGGTSKVTISVTPTSSLTPTTLYIVYTVYNYSMQDITFL